jgi:2-methylcitrate dehydratase PrpD
MAQHQATGKRKQPATALNRRDILKASGALAAAAVFAPANAAPTPVSDVTSKLSTYMSEAGARPLPRHVTEQAKYHILDTFAAMISGSQLAPGLIALQFARAHTGEKSATVVASHLLCGAIDAAFVNGIMAQSDETDDYAPLGTHPGCAIVPAAFAAAEQFGIDGERLIRAVTLGYDLANRVAITLGGQSFSHDGHKSVHSASASFGAAAAAGCAAGLNPQQMRWLLDYSAQQSSGIAAWQRDTDHTEKAFVFAGMPARNGVTGAQLVELGATGVDDILSGSDNYLEAYVPKANPATLIAQLGERFEIERTTLKKWTVGGPIQAALDALDAVLKRRPFEADEVKQLVVKLGPRMGTVVDNREMPDICVQHMLAVMLIDKTASFVAAHDKPRMKDAAVLKQRAKIQLAFDPSVEPNIEARQAIVEVTLTDGTHLAEHIKAVRGTPENPMTRDELIGKARDLITPVLGASINAKLIERVLDLENLKSAQELRPLLQPA